ncbi:MAG: prepilin-type N-terminal cleavage/methylation domain-containing protein [Oscillospiraceae bacterium]|nr:prepilin-type N-terminal cleavage/methylation domain-containing protein [Oscillospiraceae bacterium]
MFKKNGGFTLVELIVVIAILAILAGVAIPAYSGYIKKAQDAAAITELDAVATAVQAARATDSAEITKIVVSGEGAVTVTPGLNDAQKADFKLFYGAETVDTAKLTGTSYEAGATWTPADGWEIGIK